MALSYEFLIERAEQAAQDANRAVLDNVRDRASGIRDAVRYVVEDGRPGAIKA